MKLRTLKPRLQAAGNRLQTLKSTRPDVVERKRGSAGVRDRERIRQRDCGLCQECRRQGRLGVLGVDVDHIIPLWEGGSDTDENKELLCLEHHHEKSASEAVRRAAG